MPNFSLNTLIVTGKKVDEFRKAVKSKGNPLNLFKFVPKVPKELEADEKKLYSNPFEMEKSTDSTKFKNKYGEWCFKNVGTKWSGPGRLVDVKKNELMYQFDTAWVPSLGLVINASKKFPDLEFELVYLEEMRNFDGAALVINGEIKRSRHEELSESEFNKHYKTVKRKSVSDKPLRDKSICYKNIPF